MRRRERLTGFLIIFIMLTFSAYTNTINVGGRSFTDQSTTIENSGQEKSYKTEKRSSALNYQQSELNLNNREFEDKSSSSKNVLKTENYQENTFEDLENTDYLNTNKTTNEKNINSKKDINNQNNREKEAEKKLIDQIKVHKVARGESLWNIAHKYNVNIDTLIGANNISNMNSIKPGQEFKILPVKGIIYRVSPGETLAAIADKFNLKRETIMKDNNLENQNSLKIDQKLILRGAKPEFSYQDRLDQKFMYPINTRITSYYGPRWGRMHEGIDFSAPMGSPIRAVSSGRVVYSGWANGYGYVVIIEHQKGLRTLYAHNSKLLVRNGESVGKGEVISRSGNTGNSTGPHLHFEVQVNGRPENPLNYIHR